MILRRVVKPALVAAATVATAAALCAPAIAAQSASAGPERPDRNAMIDAQVRSVMSHLTLAEKIGQMFVVNVYGSTADTTNATDVAANQQLFGVDNADEMIAKYHPGGVIYFAWTDNLQSPQQIGALSNQLQQASVGDDGVPLQISADQEGGVVTRIGSPASVSPGNMAIGATFDPADAYRAAAVTGSELRAMGINVDDAPVSDVNTNPHNSADGPRSFGDRTAQVQRFVAAAIAGYQQAGVGGQAKHFPGLGDTTVNTDNGVAVTSETRQQILSTDVPPFRAAIAAGVKSIMAAHIVAPSLDPSGLPASMSQPIVTGLLRNTLHYNGIVVTDALNAGALASYTHQQIITDAINAGDDELLFAATANTPGQLTLPEAFSIAAQDVASGVVSESRIDQSVYRILRAKAELGLLRDPYTTAAKITATVGTPAHLATMAGIAQHSITLLRNQNDVLPLQANSGKHVLVTGWGVATTQNLTNALAAQGITTQHLWTGSPDQQTIDQAVAAARANDVTVVTTYNAWNDPNQQALVSALLGTGKPIVVASVGGPYDLAYFPTAPTYLAAYDYQPVSVSALAATLLGTDPTGHLPVTVPTADGTGTLVPYGTGLGYGH